jgi:hypothetical protein
MRPHIWLAGNHDWYIAPQDINEPEGESLLKGVIISTVSHEHVAGPRETAWVIAQRHKRLLYEYDSTILTDIAQKPCYAVPPEYPNIMAVHAVYAPDATPQVWLENRVRNGAEMEAYYVMPGAPWHQTSPDLPYLHFAGHTHIAGLWARHRQQGGWLDLVERHSDPQQTIKLGHPYPLEAGYFYYINPGGVGFPRGEHPCPGAAVLDTDSWTITFYRWSCSGYNVENVRQDMQALNYPDDAWSERQFKPCPCDEQSNLEE